MSSGHPSTAPREVPRFEIVSLAARPDLREAHESCGGAAWPEFMLHDPVAIKHWATLMAAFPDCQLSLLANEEIIGVINAVPLHFDGPFSELPDRGVDWGVEKSVQDHETGITPNCLMGVQIVIGGPWRSKGLSKASAAVMMEHAAARRLEHVILPVRPANKHRFPLIPMESYAAWTDEAGLPYDNWLRVHARLGGDILNVCSESMIISGSVRNWSDWTGLSFPGSGDYVVPGALNPVKIDVENDVGTYHEPNIWVVHTAPPRAGTSG